MKKRIFTIMCVAAAVMGCSKDEEASNTPAPYTLEYAGESYKTITLNGVTIMAENLRYVPEGMTISSDAADGSGLWYPYTLTTDPDTGTVTAAASTSTALGLLYNFETAMGEAFTTENYDTFEGKQGICPDGWHIPTYDDWFALCGQALSASDDTTAPFYATDDYDASYSSIIKANEIGYNFQFTGAVVNSKYNTTTVKDEYTSTTTSPYEKNVGDASFVGLPAISYTMCSTARSTSLLWVMMSGFAFNNVDGKYYLLSGATATGQAVRCVKDSE